MMLAEYKAAMEKQEEERAAYRKAQAVARQAKVDAARAGIRAALAALGAPEDLHAGGLVQVREESSQDGARYNGKVRIIVGAWHINARNTQYPERKAGFDFQKIAKDILERDAHDKKRR